MVDALSDFEFATATRDSYTGIATLVFAIRSILPNSFGAEDGSLSCPDSGSANPDVFAEVEIAAFLSFRNATASKWTAVKLDS